MSRDSGISLTIAAGALLTGFLFVIDAESWLRAVLTVLFLLVGPGLAVTRMLHLGETVSEVTIAIATSLGMETAVATALLVTGFWSPGTALAVVIIITLACVVIPFGREGQGAGDGFRQAAVAALSVGDGKGDTH
jgi:hypothetical protein